MKRFVCAALLLFVSLPALAQTTADSERISLLEEQLKELTGKVEELEFEQRAIQKKLELLENTLENTEATEPAKNASSEPASPKEPKSAPAVAEAPEAEETPRNIVPAEKEQKTAAADGTQSLGTVPVKETAEPKAAKGAESEYEEAFSLLREEKYDEVIQAFEAFAEKYPKEPLTGSAYFWIGEAHFAKKDFEQASVNYLKGYQTFPKGKKAADSLLKLALSLGELKKTKEACATLEKLFDDFKTMPASARKRANDAKKKFACE